MDFVGLVNGGDVYHKSGFQKQTNETASKKENKPNQNTHM